MMKLYSLTLFRTITIVGSSNLKAANIKNGVTIFGVKGTFTGWVDSTMSVSVIWPTIVSPNYNQFWATKDAYTNTWSVRYGYPTDHATGISVAQKLWNSGFRYINLNANLWAYDRSGSCDGSIIVRYLRWGLVGSSYDDYSSSNYVLNPDDGAPTPGHHGGWTIGDGTKKGASADFSRKIELRTTSGNYTYWGTSCGVNITLDRISNNTSRGWVKMNSFNFYFSKS